MRKLTFVLAFFATVFLSGCATSLGGASFGQADSRVEQRVRFGTVHSVRDVSLEGSSMAGTLAGGLLGGLAGSALGGGSGQKIMTMLGALGGAYAGNAFQKSATESLGQEITIRLENGEFVAITQEKDAAVALKKGDSVRIVGSGRSTRVAQV